MILRDQIQIMTRSTPPAPVGDPIPAHVGSPTSTERVSNVIGRFALVQVVALIRPGSGYDPELHTVQWRGEQWEHDGAPAHVRRHGRDHHQTIPLQRVVTS